MTAQPKYIRRDDHTTMVAVYRCRDGSHDVDYLGRRFSVCQDGKSRWVAVYSYRGKVYRCLWATWERDYEALAIVQRGGQR
jgi:hypothetical protein